MMGRNQRPTAKAALFPNTLEVRYTSMTLKMKIMIDPQEARMILTSWINTPISGRKLNNSRTKGSQKI